MNISRNSYASFFDSAVYAWYDSLLLVINTSDSTSNLVNIPTGYPKHCFGLILPAGFAVMPASNSTGVTCYLANNAFWNNESYLFCNRNFNPHTAVACTGNISSYPGWERVCLPTNDSLINKQDCSNQLLPLTLAIQLISALWI